MSELERTEVTVKMVMLDIVGNGNCSYDCSKYFILPRTIRELLLNHKIEHYSDGKVATFEAQGFYPRDSRQELTVDDVLEQLDVGYVEYDVEEYCIRSTTKKVLEDDYNIVKYEIVERRGFEEAVTHFGFKRQLKHTPVEMANMFKILNETEKDEFLKLIEELV